MRLGYRRIQGTLSDLGHQIARGTIANILKGHGIEPAPARSRKTTWKEFLTRHGELLVAADFFTVEVWTRRGLQRFGVLFLIELKTRRVEVAGIASAANGLWMNQIGRNLTDAIDGIPNGKRYLIHDRDPLFTAEFLIMLRAVGVKSVKLPARSQNLNAYAERFVRSIKESCLDHLILFGEGSLRTPIREFVTHYHLERNHQGLGNRLITPEVRPAVCCGCKRIIRGRPFRVGFMRRLRPMERSTQMESEKYIGMDVRCGPTLQGLAKTLTFQQARNGLTALILGSQKYKLDESLDAARNLIQRLNFIWERSKDADPKLSEAEVQEVNGSLFAFDQAFTLELGRSPIFYVTSRGYSTLAAWVKKHFLMSVFCLKIDVWRWVRVNTVSGKKSCGTVANYRKLPVIRSISA